MRQQPISRRSRRTFGAPIQNSTGAWVSLEKQEGKDCKGGRRQPTLDGRVWRGQLCSTTQSEPAWQSSPRSLSAGAVDGWRICSPVWKSRGVVCGTYRLTSL